MVAARRGPSGSPLRSPAKRRATGSATASPTVIATHNIAREVLGSALAVCSIMIVSAINAT